MLSKIDNSPIVVVDRHPIHAFLVPFPMACFSGALLTDLTYWRTAEMMWADFSAWLLAFGLVLGFLAALAGLFDYFTNRLVRRDARGWLHMIGSIAVLALSLLNAFVHSRDAWTSVVPTGMILSAVVVFLMIVSAFAGRSIAATTATAGHP
ncbi:DUF2231 domain-containing protein [Mesorhizobium sp. INR15]|uniref:DUF2231 domain-containing protein n=1 Tax=Mesorhizobium sp. INR15 TaxID=2654248 RepID=UPI00189655C0|nr:DUF2231 domain-containing protein [Mesorhizobium sp. INR15]QPC91586.1 DUF2231 domain-containing protein [Mesorhizobium sp. INR15]